MLLTPTNISFAADAGKEIIAQLTGEGDIILMGENISIISEENIILGDGEAGASESIIMQAVDGIDIGLGEDGENTIHLDAEAQIVSAFVKMKATTNPVVESPTAEEIAEMTAGDQAIRDQVNASATQALVEKQKAAKKKIFDGVVKALVTVGTLVVLAVATAATAGAAAPLLAYAVGGVVLAFAASDIAEGIHGYQQSVNGDLSKSFNFIRDVGFQGNEKAYEFAKFAADVIFGLVTGKAMGMLSKANKVVKLCSMAKSAGVHMATNMVTGAIKDLICDGKINWKNLAINAGLGFVQGFVGNKLGASLGAAFGGGYIANVAAKTAVDVLLDAAVSGFMGQDFNVWESIGKNLFSNMLSEAVADPIDIVTGAYLISTTDVLYPNLSQSIELKRTYQSVVKKVGSMGRGWKFKYDSCFYVDNGDIHVDTVTGHNVLFRKVDGVWETVSKGCNRFVSTENLGDQTLLLQDKKDHTTYMKNCPLLQQVLFPTDQLMLSFLSNFAQLSMEIYRGQVEK